MTGFDSTIRVALVSEGCATRSEWIDLVRRAEGLGYEALYVTDHVHQQLSPLVALAVAAEHSTRLRLGTYVLNHDMRNAVVLAKELRSLVTVAGDRVDVGLGAGWLAEDYRRTGIPFESGPVRAQRFERSVALVTAVLAGEEVDPEQISPAPVTPITVGGGGVRLLLGAGGPRMLRFAARHADIVSVLPRSTADGALDEEDGDAGAMDAKVDLVRRTWREHGRTAHLNNLVYECLVTPRPGALLQTLAGALGCRPDEVNDRPVMLVGDPPLAADVLRHRHERWGIDRVTIPADRAASFAPVLDRLP
jgi:probable F420-dependent oxidoreductase